MRAENISWTEIANTIGGKTPDACRKLYTRLGERAAQQAWSPEMDLALDEAYEKKKPDIWHLIGAEIGFKGNWKVLEKKFMARVKATGKWEL